MYDQEQLEEQQQFIIPPLPIHQFKFQHQLSGKIKTKILCIGFYGISSLYISSLIDLKNLAPTNRINFLRAKQRALASIYQQNQSTFIVFHDQFQKMKEIHLSKFIQENFIFEEIIIFANRAKGLHQNQIISPLYFIGTSFVENKLQTLKYPQGLLGPEADLLQWGEINKVSIMCYIGIYDEYQVKWEQIKEIFGKVSGKYGLESCFDISSEIKKYNMVKYANKLYL